MTSNRKFDPAYIYCSQNSCDARIKNNGWSKIKSEWFFQHNGKAWCPKHYPSWMEEWRRKQMLQKQSLMGILEAASEDLKKEDPILPTHGRQYRIRGRQYQLRRL